ncbi:hypothetical protein SteCoe_26310 [Stentor coeruleus]|uniref:Casein kinase I n=1 Tax=Stentor coeruleus TaxID=5963 RepID=A0A1R2BD50_9CILI|nr:hypothetical protein SteCoe_26310 [Stentor coeruleus]
MNGNRFIPDKELGKGSFGVVYKAWDSLKSQDVALKLSDKSHKNSFLSEIQVLSCVSGKKGFPKMIWKGEFQGQLAIAMELLGSSLTAKFKKDIISIGEACEIGIQTVKAIETLHKESFLHQDLKPCNILMGQKGEKTYHLIDFGISRGFIDRQTRHHIPLRTETTFKGNLVFCSSNLLNGIQASRRDDIISLLLILFFVIKKGLPWIKNTKSIHDMLSSRISVSIFELNKGVPCEIAECLSYAQGLSFYQKPDYKWIVNMLKRCKSAFDLEKTEILQIKSLKDKNSLKKNEDHRAKSECRSRNLLDFNSSTIKVLAPDFSEEMRQKIVVSRRSNN